MAESGGGEIRLDLAECRGGRQGSEIATDLQANLFVAPCQFAQVRGPQRGEVGHLV